MVKDTRMIHYKFNKNDEIANPQPSPNDRYARSMDAVQRLNVSGLEEF
jgi:hypothetical protein